MVEAKDRQVSASIKLWIERAGVPRATVWERLGICESGLSYKLNGIRKFTLSEALAVYDLLMRDHLDALPKRRRISLEHFLGLKKEEAG